MLKKISITCEEGKIKIYWEWNDQSVESVAIFYKKSNILNGDGTSFLSSIIMRYPHRMSGSAERQLVDERGLYTFTFLPKGQNGGYGDKIVLPNIMLGKPMTVYWKIQERREGDTIVFPQLSERLPAGSACLLGEGFCFPLDYEIDESTKLVFGNGIADRHLEIAFREPYNKVYEAKKIQGYKLSL